MEWFVDRVIGAVVVLGVFSPATGPCAVLDGLDREREQAWAAGDVRVLGGLYATGQDVPDVDALRSWTGRGLRVEGARLERSRCEPGEGRARVVERLGPAVAVTRSGERRRLPRDTWSERTIVLRFDERWRIAEVAAVSADRDG